MKAPRRRKATGKPGRTNTKRAPIEQPAPRERTDQERMDEFFATTRYVGRIADWRTMPELGIDPDDDE